MKSWAKYLLALSVALFSAGCSTTRFLPEGESRLVGNNISVTGADKSFNEKELDTYIRQKPTSWSSQLCVYNWVNPNDSTKFASFVRSFGKRPTVLDENLVTTSANNIRSHLEYIGYYGSTVSTEVLKNNKKATVNYNITLGKRYPIAKIGYTVPERGDFASDFLSDTASVSVRKGDYLSESALDDETERSAAVMRKKGYYGFSKSHYFFTADTVTVPGQAILDMAVKEYTRNEEPTAARVLNRYTFGNVDVILPARYIFKEKILSSLNTIHTGAPYSETTVNNTYSRFSSVSSFSGVNIEMTTSETDPYAVDCAINLTPARQQGFKLNLEGSINSNGLYGISPEVSYFHRNLFRGGEVLNVSFMGNFQFKPSDSKARSTELGISASVEFPRFIGMPYSVFRGKVVPKTEIKASYNYQDRPEYTRNIIQTSLGYTWSHGQWYYQFNPLQLSIVRLFDIMPEFVYKLLSNPFMLNSYMNHFDLGTWSSIYYTTNPDVNPKTSYQYMRLQVATAGNLLSLFNGTMKKNENGAGMIWSTPYSQYVRAELQLGKTWRFGKDNGQAFATRLLAGAGYAYGNSETLPFEQHFYSGGSNSLRGWQAREVGPGLMKQDTSFVIPNQTGDMKLEANAEYRFHAFWKLDGALFVDAGNVWTLQDVGAEGTAPGKLKAKNFFESVAMDWGVGMRFDASILLIRLDLGMQLHDPAQDAGERWYGPDKWLKRGHYALNFGIGYPF